MSTSVVLPALGESVTEGTVTRWLKKVGDTIQADEGLLEISTDKVDTEIPSPVSGVIEEILVQEDETVEVGAILAKIGDGSGASSSDSIRNRPHCRGSGGMWRRYGSTVPRGRGRPSGDHAATRVCPRSLRIRSDPARSA